MQVLVSFQLINRTGGTIKSIVFNVIDCDNARLMRGAHEQDGVCLPHEIDAQSVLEIPLAFAVDDPMSSQHLRGVVTYIIHVSFLIRFGWSTAPS